MLKISEYMENAATERKHMKISNLSTGRVIRLCRVQPVGDLQVVLLSHTELGKDGSEDFVVGDFARDGAQMVEYAAELLAEQIRGQRTVDSDKRPSESRVGRCQGFVVAGRRDHGIAVVEGIGVDCRAERLPQAVDAHPFAGGNGDRAGGKGGAGGLVDFIDDVDDPTVRSRTGGGGAVGWCGGKGCFRKV